MRGCSMFYPGRRGLRPKSDIIAFLHGYMHGAVGSCDYRMNNFHYRLE